MSGRLVRRLLRSLGPLALLMAAVMELLVRRLFLHASVSHTPSNLAITFRACIVAVSGLSPHFMGDAVLLTVEPRPSILYIQSVLN
jgi:hypothetical protein